MKNYMIINGTGYNLIKARSMDQAREKAINYFDHSKEIIVREITYAIK